MSSTTRFTLVWCTVLALVGCGSGSTAGGSDGPVDRRDAGAPDTAFDTAVDAVAGDAELGDADVAFAVAAVNPPAGETDVPVDTRVVIDFTHALDTATLTVQPAWGPCDATASFALSRDDFVTCAGGTLAFPEPQRVQFLVAHRVLDSSRTFRVRLAASVADTDGQALAASYQPAQGFTTATPPCTATADPTAKDGTGAVCVAPVFEDNGDGTITDLANKLLWAKCSLAGDGTVKNGTDFGCEAPALPNDIMKWELAVKACDDLVLAGRDDWRLPDVAQLQSLLTESGDPRIDTTFFPNSGNIWYVASSTYSGDPRSHWAMLFGASGFSGSGYGGKTRTNPVQFVRCVAGSLPQAAPQLAPMYLQFANATTVTVQFPPAYTAAVPPLTKTGYVGVDGAIGLVGTTVVNALQGPIDFTTYAGQPEEYSFSGLAANTPYRVIVVAENAAGHADAQLATSTAAIAPVLRPAVVVSWQLDEIVLQRPTFSTIGNPAPTVLAYLGPKGDVSASGSTITGYTRGPVDVSSLDYTFSGLVSNLTYVIYVVAANTEGYSTVAAEQHLGRYFDNGDGTVYSPAGNLTWRRCVAGQSWTGAGDNGCAGNAVKAQFCWQSDNDCNGGIGTGLLGPPWLDEDLCSGCSGFSTAWDACDRDFAGRSDWRVPTEEEIRTLVDVDYSPPLNTAAFPSTPTGDFWTASSISLMNAAVFESPGGFVSGGLEKDADAYVRCVASGR